MAGGKGWMFRVVLTVVDWLISVAVLAFVIGYCVAKGVFFALN